MKRVVADRINTEEPAKATPEKKTEPAAPREEEAPVKKSLPSPEKVSPVKKLPELAPAKSLTSAEAAASWLSSAKSEIADTSSSGAASSIVSGPPISTVCYSLAAMPFS